MSQLTVPQEINKRNNTPINSDSPRNEIPNPLICEDILTALNTIKPSVEKPPSDFSCQPIVLTPEEMLAVFDNVKVYTYSENPNEYPE